MKLSTILMLSSQLLLPGVESWSPLSSRRKFVALTSAAFGSSLFPNIAHGVPPLTDSELTRLEKMLSVSPPGDKIKRQPLAQDFAVLLTRTSYVETDQLDILPVNQLERDMYRLRTAAYEPYKQRVGSIMQGDLTDPKYFDYMQIVQYLIMNRAIKDPETEFEEMQPDSQDTESEAAPKLQMVRVKRTLPDELLVSTFDERVGTSILDYFLDRYKGTPIALPEFPKNTKPAIPEVEQALSQLVKIFLINGFAWDGKSELVKQSGDKATFVMTLQGPATLWSGQILANQRAPVRNDYLLKTAKRLLHSMGYSVTASSTKIQGDKEVTTLTIA